MTMTDLVVIVPSRGRPEAARALAQAFADTCTADTFLTFAVDDDDPTLEQYKTVGDGVHSGTLILPSHTMSEALNLAARSAANGAFAVGFMGDDHRPRTHGWDRAYLDALHELGTGIVYGDDQLQGENLPTQIAITADIVRALGYMAPPTLRHMYLDNFWRDLGNATGCLRYLPDVIVEHLHPFAGKAEWTEGHLRVNDQARVSADERAYRAYRQSGFLDDVAKVHALRGKEVHEVHEWRLFDEGTIPEYTRPEWYAGREHVPHLEQDGHRDRLMATASLVARIAWSHDLRTVVDLGAGDGGLLSLLGPAVKAWGYDLTPSNIDAAKERGVDVRLGDVVAGDIEWGQIAVCTEMLEHLVDPHGFVRAIAQHSQALVCSSPWLERPGSAYEFHTWCWDLDGYRSMIETNGWKVLRQQYVHGFQLILAVRP